MAASSSLPSGTALASGAWRTLAGCAAAAAISAGACSQAVARRTLAGCVAVAAILAGVSSPVGAQEAAAENELASRAASFSFHLLTAEPGDALWELFGHNALLVRDSATGRETAYNFGLFDFGAPGFAGRFVRGEMMYWADTMPPAAMLARYREQDRRVWAQELDLEPAQKAALLSLLSAAVRPDSRHYRYDYFRQNCSTKLRDALDGALGGQVRAATDEPGRDTWRTHTKRLTARNIVGYLGIQLLAGPRSDETTSAWQNMWAPMKLRDTLAGLTVVRSDGSVVPLVRSDVLLAESGRAPEPAEAPSLAALFLLSGAAAGLLFVILAHWAGGGSRLGSLAFGVAGVLWGLLCGAISATVIGMHWTDHEFLYMNRNVLIFSPAGLLLAALFPVVAVRPAAGAKAAWVAALPVALSLAALGLWALPGAGQDNLEWIAFALPVHAGVLWSMARAPKLRDRLAAAELRIGTAGWGAKTARRASVRRIPARDEA